MGRKAKYRLRCTTEDTWVNTDYIEDKPTVCPNDSNHDVLEDSITIYGYESLDIADFIEEGEINYVVNDVEQRTTSTTYQEKVVLNLTNLPSTRYKIVFYSEVTQTHNGGGVQIQCTVNGEEIAQFGMEPDDKNVDYETFSGFTVMDLSGNVEIKINWKKSSHSSQGTAVCRRGRIEVTKAL